MFIIQQIQGKARLTASVREKLEGPPFFFFFTNDTITYIGNGMTVTYNVMMNNIQYLLGRVAYLLENPCGKKKTNTL